MQRLKGRVNCEYITFDSYFRKHIILLSFLMLVILFQGDYLIKAVLGKRMLALKLVAKRFIVIKNFDFIIVIKFQIYLKEALI
jgi:hypothetical protein